MLQTLFFWTLLEMCFSIYIVLLGFFYSLKTEGFIRYEAFQNSKVWREQICISFINDIYLILNLIIKMLLISSLNRSNPSILNRLYLEYQLGSHSINLVWKAVNVHSRKSERDLLTQKWLFPTLYFHQKWPLSSATRTLIELPVFVSLRYTFQSFNSFIFWVLIDLLAFAFTFSHWTLLS